MTQHSKNSESFYPREDLLNSIFMFHHTPLCSRLLNCHIQRRQCTWQNYAAVWKAYTFHALDSRSELSVLIKICKKSSPFLIKNFLFHNGHFSVKSSEHFYSQIGQRSADLIEKMFLLKKYQNYVKFFFRNEQHFLDFFMGIRNTSCSLEFPPPNVF